MILFRCLEDIHLSSLGNTAIKTFDINGEDGYFCTVRWVLSRSVRLKLLSFSLICHIVAFCQQGSQMIVIYQILIAVLNVCLKLAFTRQERGQLAQYVLTRKMQLCFQTIFFLCKAETLFGPLLH